MSAIGVIIGAGGYAIAVLLTIGLTLMIISISMFERRFLNDIQSDK